MKTNKQVLISQVSYKKNLIQGSKPKKIWIEKYKITS